VSEGSWAALRLVIHVMLGLESDVKLLVVKVIMYICTGYLTPTTLRLAPQNSSYLSAFLDSIV
jgi:hypothetical protein